jgi:hypothetical protein
MVVHINHVVMSKRHPRRLGQPKQYTPPKNDHLQLDAFS